MNLKMIISAILIFFIVALSVFTVFLMKGTGYEENTSWGSWYQEYEIVYTDGTTAPLSFYHDGKTMDSLTYVLEATVNTEYTNGNAVFDYSGFHVDVEVNNNVLDSYEFSGSKTIQSSDGQTQLVERSMPLDGLNSLSNGTYAVHFIPRGSILVDDETSSLPSSASVMVRVGSVDDTTPPDDTPDDDDKEVSFKSEVIWA